MTQEVTDMDVWVPPIKERPPSPGPLPVDMDTGSVTTTEPYEPSEVASDWSHGTPEPPGAFFSTLPPRKWELPPSPGPSPPPAPAPIPRVEDEEPIKMPRPMFSYDEEGEFDASSSEGVLLDELVIPSPQQQQAADPLELTFGVDTNITIKSYSTRRLLPYAFLGMDKTLEFFGDPLRQRYMTGKEGPGYSKVQGQEHGVLDGGYSPTGTKLPPMYYYVYPDGEARSITTWEFVIPPQQEESPVYVAPGVVDLRNGVVGEDPTEVVRAFINLSPTKPYRQLSERGSMTAILAHWTSLTRGPQFHEITFFPRNGRQMTWFLLHHDMDAYDFVSKILNTFKSGDEEAVASDLWRFLTVRQRLFGVFSDDERKTIMDNGGRVNLKEYIESFTREARHPLAEPYAVAAAVLIALGIPPWIVNTEPVIAHWHDVLLPSNEDPSVAECVQTERLARRVMSEEFAQDERRIIHTIAHGTSYDDGYSWSRVPGFFAQHLFNSIYRAKLDIQEKGNSVYAVVILVGFATRTHDAHANAAVFYPGENRLVYFEPGGYPRAYVQEAQNIARLVETYGLSERGTMTIELTVTDNLQEDDTVGYCSMLSTFWATNQVLRPEQKDEWMELLESRDFPRIIQLLNEKHKNVTYKTPDDMATSLHRFSQTIPTETAHKLNESNTRELPPSDGGLTHTIMGPERTMGFDPRLVMWFNDPSISDPNPTPPVFGDAPPTLLSLPLLPPDDDEEEPPKKRLRKSVSFTDSEPSVKEFSADKPVTS